MNISHWFFAYVENVNDPLEIGRVQVRCLEYHSLDHSEIPSEALPWATVIMPVTSASSNGVGTSPNGLVEGSFVLGFFKDGDSQQEPVVIGSISSQSGLNPSTFDVASKYGTGDLYRSNPAFLGRDAPRDSSTTGSTYGDSYSQSLMTSGLITNAGNGMIAEPKSVFESPLEPVTLGGGSILSYARNEIGVVETRANQGKGISKYWSAVDYSNGYGNPWCAAFVSWIIQQSAILPEEHRPTTASAFGIEKWAKSKISQGHSFVRLIRRPREVQSGDLVVFSWSHVGIAASNSEGSGFRTIEGNTTIPGRAQQGVAEKSRKLSSVRSVVRIG